MHEGSAHADMVDLPTLGVAAALLSVERLTYIAVWSRPAWFQAVCRRLGSPVDVLASLFIVFKLIQVSVFVGWCLVHGGGRLLPAGRSVGILSLAAGLLMAGQTLLEAGKAEQAVTWLESGIALAREKGDGKALGELESALAEAKE